MPTMAERQFAPRVTAAGLAVVMGLAVAAAQGPAQAQSAATAPDPTLGGALADRLCASCHLVRPGQTGTTTPGVPPFTAIANRPGQSRANIVQVLIAPHGAMPDVGLTRTEISHLLAYIDSQRDPALPSLLPEFVPETEKPKYPQPS